MENDWGWKTNWEASDPLERYAGAQIKDLIFNGDAAGLRSALRSHALPQVCTLICTPPDGFPPDMEQVLCEALADPGCKVKMLGFHSVDIQHGFSSPLCEALLRNTSIEAFRFAFTCGSTNQRGLPLNDEFPPSLQTFLLNRRKMVGLSIYGALPEGGGALYLPCLAPITAAVRANPFLEQLTLYHCLAPQISLFGTGQTAEFTDLCNVIAAHPSLKKLGIGALQILQTQLGELFIRLRTSRLERLKLWELTLTGPLVTQLCEWLQQGSLLTLMLRRCVFQDEADRDRLVKTALAQQKLCELTVEDSEVESFTLIDMTGPL